MSKQKNEFEVRCQFNSFCKNTLKNELKNILRTERRRRSKEISIEELSPNSKMQLSTTDRYFENIGERFYTVHGTEISDAMLYRALKSLSAEKLRIVCLYYFSDKSDQEISDLCKIPRSTVQYQRSSAFEMLKKDLEEQTDEQ